MALGEAPLSAPERDTASLASSREPCLELGRTIPAPARAPAATIPPDTAPACPSCCCRSWSLRGSQTAYGGFSLSPFTVLTLGAAFGTFFMLFGRKPGLGMIRIKSCRATLLPRSSALMRAVGTRRIFRFSTAGVIAKDEDSIWKHRSMKHGSNKQLTGRC